MIKKITLILIIIFGFILRFWHLGSNPPSLDWDEASLGYNAYSILKTGRDEYGNLLPLSIRSFNDYKPPIYTYLTIVPVYMFGLNEFSTRFVSSFFGSLTIIVLYYLIKELFPQKGSRFRLFVIFLLAISPWHIQFSRVAFEANLALFFFVTGILFLLRGIRKSSYIIWAFIVFAISMYTYHSVRLVAPLLIFAFVIVFWRKLRDKLFALGISISLFVILILPIFVQLQSSSGKRFGAVTLMNEEERLKPSINSIEYDKSKMDKLGAITHNRRIVFGKDILAGFLDHFNFDFLFLNGDPPGRHHAVGMGMLYLWDLPFILFGIYYLLNFPEIKKRFLIIWFLLAPAASAITTGTPHAVRSLLYIPTYQIFSAIGVFTLIKKVKYSNQKLLVIIFTLLIINFYYYLHMYWIHTPLEYSQWWQYGYRQVVQNVTKIENKYSKVIITYRYDQPYIFFLFYNKIDPSWYQSNWGEGEVKRARRDFGRYEFRNIIWENDSKIKNAIIVGTPQEIPEGALGIIKEIKFLDGSVAFRIAST